MGLVGVIVGLNALMEVPVGEKGKDVDGGRKDFLDVDVDGVR